MDNEPISNAVHQMAMSLHEEMVHELERPELMGFEERLAMHRKNYPGLLFGELAMHLADVELAPDASGPDRSRAIVEALRRISTTPALFEMITNAPYTQELATGLTPKLPETIQRDDKEIAEARELQKKVAEAGYFNRDMAPDNRIIQLHYTIVQQATTKKFGRIVLPAETSTVVLKIIPYVTTWEIKRYGRWDDRTGFSQYMDNRSDSLKVFKVVSAASTSSRPNSIEFLVGQQILTGDISTGTNFKIRYNPRRKVQEVPGHESNELTTSTTTLPAKLTQAYFGNSLDFPLFPTA